MPSLCRRTNEHVALAREHEDMEAGAALSAIDAAEWRK